VSYIPVPSLWSKIHWGICHSGNFSADFRPTPGVQQPTVCLRPLARPEYGVQYSCINKLQAHSRNQRSHCMPKLQTTEGIDSVF
jgi:hypothetical protein